MYIVISYYATIIVVNSGNLDMGFGWVFYCFFYYFIKMTSVGEQFWIL